MLNMTEMRIQIDELTGGSLKELNRVCVRDGLNPNLCLSSEKEGSRYTFFATDNEGQVRYHKSVLAPTDQLLENQLEVWLKMRDLKNETARVQKGLVRLSVGLDPEDSDKPSITVH